MISGNIEKFNSPIRQISGKVELTAKGSAPATKTGTLIHIDDACSSAMPMSIQLSSDTITDFSKIGIATGKNIFGGEALAEAIVGIGGTANDNDGTTSFAPGKVSRTTPIYDGFKENTQYTFMMYGINESSPNATNLAIYYTDGSYEGLYFNGGSGYENPTPGEYAYSRLTSAAGKTIQSLRVLYVSASTTLQCDKCGIFEGTITLEEFEPYTETPIPVEVKLTGKNILPYPYTQTTKNAYGLEWTDNGDGSLTLNGTTEINWVGFDLQRGAADIAKIKLVPGTSYIISGGAGGVDFIFNYLNENGADAWWPEKKPLVWKDTYTLKSVYLQISNAGTTFNNLTVYPQIEISTTTATAWEPYNGQTAAANPEGKVEGLTSRGTPFYLFTNPLGITMTATYQKQLNADNEIFTHDGDLVSFVVDKTGEDKFFGYGISQKLEVKVRDKDRRYNVYTHHAMKPYLDDLTVLPLFNVRDVKRDENTNALTITAYDCIENAAKHTWSDLSITDYTLSGIARAIAVVIEAGGVVCPYDEFNALYEDGINVEGTESLREILNDIAEATQTIYYVDSNNNLAFKRLGGSPVYTIDKSQYFTLKSEPSRTLAAIVSATELGDNIIADSDEGEGETQYVRDNVFWTEDVAAKVEAALANVGGTTITPFDCSWRGCYLLEPGDKVAITTKDNGTITTYLLNDKLTYNGGMKQHTHWTYGAEEETAANPSTLGEALKQTFAKVDKANKRIDLVVSDVSENQSAISSLQINEKSITATVEGLQKTTETATGEIETLSQKVSTQITQDQVSFAITTELAKGVDKVATKEKNYTFDDEGLSISSSENNISTTITEDGMTVKKSGEDVLIANKDGVLAEDLKATTFLIIAGSRFENYGGRTGCFWIGG